MAVIETMLEDEASARVRIQFNEFIANARSNRREIALLYARAINPWVPYETGKLANYRVNNEGDIIYSAYRYEDGEPAFNYAAMQYNRVDYKHPSTGKHPLATDHWDEVAEPIIWEGFVHDVNELLGTKGRGRKPNKYMRKLRASRRQDWGKK